MTNLQENKLSMYIVLNQYCNQYTAILKSLPNYNANIAALQNIIDQIQNTSVQQSYDRTGIAKTKQTYRDTMTTLALDTSRKLIAYAKYNNNPVLLNEIKYSPTQLKQMRDTAISDCAHLIYTRAQTFIASLNPYAINPASQTALNNAIDSYNAVISAPRLGITNRSVATHQMVLQFATAKQIIDNLDAAIQIIRLTQPDTYKGYKSARKIVRNGTGTLALIARVTSEGIPLKGVTLKFTPQQPTNLTVTNILNPLTKTTAPKGGIKIKTLAQGTYTVTITKPGYTPQTLTTYITHNQLTTLKTTLNKITTTS